MANNRKIAEALINRLGVGETLARLLCIAEPKALAETFMPTPEEVAWELEAHATRQTHDEERKVVQTHPVAKSLAALGLERDEVSDLIERAIVIRDQRRKEKAALDKNH